MEIKACKDKITEIIEQGKIKDENDTLRVQYFIHMLRVFHAELLTYLKKWNELSLLVEVSSPVDAPWHRFKNYLQEIVNSGALALGTYEAIADILVRSPVQTIFDDQQVTILFEIVGRR